MAETLFFGFDNQQLYGLALAALWLSSVAAVGIFAYRAGTQS